MARQICIETGANNESRLQIEKQAKIGCSTLKETIFKKGLIRPEFQYGFHLVGHSQGGLIARQVFESCPEIRPYVATITTDGTPNLGVEKLPDLTKFGMEDSPKLAKAANCILWLVEKWVKFFRFERDWSFLQYLNPSKGYSKFIERLNYKATAHYQDLELFNMLMYSDDFVVVPRSSATFGTDYVELENGEGSWQPFALSPFASELGFDKLYPVGGMNFCFVRNTHLNKQGGEWNDAEYLTTDVCPRPSFFLNAAQLRKEYKKCSRNKMALREWEEMKCAWKTPVQRI
jgi:hypothetical protein